MKLARLRSTKGSRVVRGNRRSQAAEMVIAPGEAVQWRFGIDGTGSALVKKKRYSLVARTKGSGLELMHSMRRFKIAPA
jgi:hypothetical protein